MRRARSFSLAGFVGLAMLASTGEGFAALLPGTVIIDGDKRFEITFCEENSSGNVVGGCADLTFSPLSVAIPGSHPGLLISGGPLSALATMDATGAVVPALLDISFGYTFQVLDPGKSVLGLSLIANIEQTNPDCPLCYGQVVETLLPGQQFAVGIGAGTSGQLSNFLPLGPGVTSGTIVKDIELASHNPNNRVSISVVTQDFAQVPEPASLTLVGLGTLGLWRLRRRP